LNNLKEIAKLTQKIPVDMGGKSVHRKPLNRSFNDGVSRKSAAANGAKNYAILFWR
jgi:hypothetical protein